MTDNIQYVWLIIYLFALVALFTYGMNCYLLMVFYRLKRPKALTEHAEIKKKFYRDFSAKDWPKVTIQLLPAGSMTISFLSTTLPLDDSTTVIF